MTLAEIQEQLDATRIVTKKLKGSREASEKFLIAAGIIKDETKAPKKKKKSV
jgi:hypothetical protein